MTQSSPETIGSDFETLHSILSSERFLKMESTGNEVPLFLKPYAIEHEHEVNPAIDALGRRLTTGGLNVLKIHLLDLVADVLAERDLLPRLLEKESALSKSQLGDTMRRLTDPKTALVPAIVKKLSESKRDLTLIYGVGAVFPFIRTHTLLENLQPVIGDHPIVMFFPGDYRHQDGSGSSLSLFGCLEHKGYYRAFNLDHYHL